MLARFSLVAAFSLFSSIAQAQSSAPSIEQFFSKVADALYDLKYKTDKLILRHSIGDGFGTLGEFCDALTAHQVADCDHMARIANIVCRDATGVLLPHHNQATWQNHAQKCPGAADAEADAAYMKRLVHEVFQDIEHENAPVEGDLEKQRDEAQREL